MNQAPVIIVDYDPCWPRLFEQEKDLILRTLAGMEVRVEHVGSTSVRGLAAKPIVDIMVEVASREDGERAVPLLTAQGYMYEGEAGIPGRFYFDKGEPRTHHLHMYPRGNPEWERHILFRDYLRAHSDVVQAYAELKRALAEKYRNDRPAYTDAKTEFIAAIIARAREAAAENKA